MKRRIKISRLNRGDEFEYNGQKYVVFNTIVGFGTEVVAKSVKNGQSVKIHRDVEVSVG
jgi:hypothetical protein